MQERSLDTVVRAVSAAVLPVVVDFTSLKGLSCAPGPATTRRGMLVTNGIRAGVQVRAVAWLGLYAHLTARTTVSKERSPSCPSCASARQSRNKCELFRLTGLDSVYPESSSISFRLFIVPTAFWAPPKFQPVTPVYRVFTPLGCFLTFYVLYNNYKSDLTVIINVIVNI